MKKMSEYFSLLRSMKDEWKWLGGYARLYKFNIALYVVLGLAATAMSLGAAVASKQLIDSVVYHFRDTVFRYAALVVLLTVFQLVFHAFSSYLISAVSTKTGNDIRHEIYSKIMLGDWEKISEFHSGDLLNRLEGDVGTVSSGIVSFIPNVFTKSLQFLGSLFIVLYYDKTMAVLALLGAPILFLSSRVLVKKLRGFNKKSREVNGRIISFSEESLQNVQIIKSFDLSRQYIESFRSLLGEFRTVKLAFERFSVLTTLGISLVGTAVAYACYGWGVYRLWQGAVSFGTMTLFLQLSGTLRSSFSALAALVPSAVSIATSAGRIMEVTSFEQEKDKEREKAVFMLEKSAEGLSVIFDAVSFSYEGSDQKVFDKLSFKIKSGEAVAVTGCSGRGKTTALRLLLGLVSPSEGSVRIETADNESIEVSDSTRRFFAFVPQSSGLFSGTVRDNLLTVKPDASEGELWDALEKAVLSDFIRTLPDKLETVLGENGTKLSQGQAQRLAIARAILCDSKILLLDEATSALDSETEKKLLENIMSLPNGRIIIATAHRKSVVDYCDRVIEL